MSRISRLGPDSLLQLHIELENSDPSIWRRVLVPDNITLVKLHRVIQEAMGWYDYHLHEFIIDGQHYGPVNPDYNPVWDLAPEMLNEQRKKLLKVLGHKKSFKYIYDYGDSWWHKIKLEKRLPLTSLQTSATCVDGEMACPPEDVGGLWGYYNFLEAMQDPKHEEHENMLEWWGEPFDSNHFDLSKINRLLSQIKL